MTNWTAVLEVTKNVLEGTCSDLLNTDLSYAENLVMSDNLASSIFNGTYFIRLKGVSNVDDTVNGQFSPTYNIALEVCYQISAGDSVNAYNNAIEDIEVIIREMLKQQAWEDYTENVQYIRVSNIEEPKYLLKGETFMIIPINFDFTLISNY